VDIASDVRIESGSLDKIDFDIDDRSLFVVMVVTVNVSRLIFDVVANRLSEELVAIVVTIFESPIVEEPIVVGNLVAYSVINDAAAALLDICVFVEDTVSLFSVVLVEVSVDIPVLVEEIVVDSG
jgi:hypothetical protein